MQTIASIIGFIIGISIVGFVFMCVSCAGIYIKELRRRKIDAVGREFRRTK